MSPEELFGEEEELCAELANYLVEGSLTGLTYLKHPLIGTLYAPSLNGMLNRMLIQQRRHLDDLERGGDFETAVMVHDKPWRVKVFHDRYAKLMGQKRAAELLLDLWTMTEFPEEFRDIWLKLFEEYAKLSERMTASKIALGDKPIPVHRGMSAQEADSEDYGMAWTRDLKIAKWFAKRFSKDGVVVSAAVNPRDIYAHTDDRNEDEIIVNPLYLLNPRRAR